MRITVVGAGAMGGSYGGLLARAGHEVSLIDAWPAHVDAINGRGCGSMASGPVCKRPHRRVPSLAASSRGEPTSRSHEVPSRHGPDPLAERWRRARARTAAG